MVRLRGNRVSTALNYRVVEIHQPEVGGGSLYFSYLASSPFYTT
ncbi:MAG TPA: hypothetical protein V6D25_07085 [Leptolyngbyaceae cyanobacterium]